MKSKEIKRVAALCTAIAMVLTVVLSGCVGTNPQDNENTTNSTAILCKGLLNKSCSCPPRSTKVQLCGDGGNLYFTKGIEAHYTELENETLEICGDNDFCFICIREDPLCNVPTWKDTCTNISMGYQIRHVVEDGVLVKKCECVTEGNINEDRRETVNGS